MSNQKAPTAIQTWIEARDESAEDTAAYFTGKGLEISRESIRRWRLGEAVGKKFIAPVSRITKISISALLGA